MPDTPAPHPIRHALAQTARGLRKTAAVLWRILCVGLRLLWRGLLLLTQGCLWGIARYKKASPWRQRGMLLLLFVVGLLILLPLDGTLFNLMPEKLENPPPDVWMMFRKIGHLLLWFGVGLAWILMDWKLLAIRPVAWAGWSLRGVVRWVWGTAYRVRHTRGAVLFLSALASCAVAEILKVFIRRERAHWEGFETLTFRPFWDGDLPFWESLGNMLTTSGLSTPSSHTAVAFGAAFALIRFFPTAAPVWFLMALGCGVSRLVHRAHVPTDIYLSIFVSYVVVWAVFVWLKPEKYLPKRADASAPPAHIGGTGI